MAQYTVVHGGGTSLVTLNQKQNGGQWNLLGTYSFAPSSGHQVTLTASADGTVIADAIRLVGTGPAPADLVYLHTDQIGLPQKITDATQAIVWDRVQDPFGRQVSLTNSGGIDTSLRFPGQQADPDTGFAYNYFRDYDPTIGRYIQADPIGLAGGVNRYAYAAANPLKWFDRYGLDIWIEGPNPSEPAFHQSINVGNPGGAYSSYSYGLNDNLLGEVYLDEKHGGDIERIKVTTPVEDEAFRLSLESLLGRVSIYGVDDICRSFSQRMFNEAPGDERFPPYRPPMPGSYARPSLGTVGGSTTESTSSIGTGTSR